MVSAKSLLSSMRAGYGSHFVIPPRSCDMLVFAVLAESDGQALGRQMRRMCC